MAIGGDTIIPRSVTPGGREIEQVAVYAVGSRVAQALITGAEKAKEITTAFDPMSYTAWLDTKSAIALERPSITIVLIEPDLPTITLDYEECGFMGDEFPEMKGGEAAEFVPTVKWQPTRVRVNGKLATSTDTI
jgi:hypothetical protein